MGMTSLFLLYSALGVLIATVEIQRLKAGRPFDALTLFNGAYFLFFVFVPLNVLAFGEIAVRQKYAYQMWSHGDGWTAVSLLLCYVVFILGYYRKRMARPSSVIVHDAMRLAQVVRWLVGGYVILGVIALAYHVSLTGGLTEALWLAPKVRTGEYPLQGGYLFIRQFAYFLATAFMLLWVLYLDTTAIKTPGRRAKRMLLSFMLVFLGVVFVYYALTTYGRREFIYPVIICLFCWAVAGDRRSWSGLGILLTLCVIWFGMYSFIIPTAISAPAISAPAISAAVNDFLSYSYWRVVQGLGDSFMHFVAAQHAKLWQFGFLSDIWELPLQFVPSQVLGFERPRGMFGETSEFILGRPLEPGLSGEEPLGLHGYLLVNFSYVGMFLLFYLMGIGYRALDATLGPAKSGSALIWLIYLWAVVGALEFLREGVLILVLKPRFSWWLAIGILLWVGRRRSARSSTWQQSLQQNG